MPSRRPLIGCTTYCKIAQQPQVPVYGLMPAYTDAVSAAGGVPVLIPLGLDQEGMTQIFDRIDGLLLPGGGDIDPKAYQGSWHPQVAEVDEERDRVEIFLARLAFELGKPLLAICRGLQLINVALGGTLYEDVFSQMTRSIRHDHDHLRRTELPHEVTIASNSRLSQVMKRAVSPVNSMHHQGIRNLAPGLVVSAQAPDGLIEGVEGQDHPYALGVQWHPENLVASDPAMMNLFQSFVEFSANGHG